MELLLGREPAAKGTSAVYRSPVKWLHDQRLSREFWTFFWAAFFFDFGFAVYYFLFNLYLLDLHLNERSIGLVAGALTMGSVVGTLPAGLAAKKYGVGRLLRVCFIAAPLIGILRVMVPEGTGLVAAHVGLGFLSGLAMCLWGVCFLPALARATTEENRASGFSLIFSVSIGTSTLGGLVCGYLPVWLKAAGHPMQGVEVKQIILVVACVIAAIGLTAVLRMRNENKQDHAGAKTEARLVGEPEQAARLQNWRLNPFLLRFLPAMALWTGVLAAFTPFANIYLSTNLHIPLSEIGVIFSVAQVVQLLMGLLTPWLFRTFGLVNGIIATQVLTAVALLFLAAAHNAHLAIAIYLGFSATQWMSSPGLYNLLMTATPEPDRSMASSMTMFCNAVFSSVATAGAGSLFVRYGYPLVLAGIGAFALLAATIFYLFVDSHQRSATLVGNVGGSAQADPGEIE